MPPRLKSRPSPALHPSSSVVISLIFLYFVLSVDAFQFLQPLPYSRRFLHRNLHLHRHLKAARTALPPSVVVPEHLALVLDGNGRWAQQRGLPRGAGHMEGTQRAFDVLKTCQVRKESGERVGRVSYKKRREDEGACYTNLRHNIEI